MKTQGEIENAISESLGRFEQKYMRRGPKDVHVPRGSSLENVAWRRSRYPPNSKGQRTTRVNTIA
jgi:hypothetical protein